jgi:hypothetical protein
MQDVGPRIGGGKDALDLTKPQRQSGIADLDLLTSLVVPHRFTFVSFISFISSRLVHVLNPALTAARPGGGVSR